MMKEEFIENFESFRGNPMILPSGTVFDNVVLDYVLNLKRQSTAHSFVWDSKDDLFNLFSIDEDRAALK
ncbi:hypothetical protein FBU30_000956, partial [Linnemannia zychae]